MSYRLLLASASPRRRELLSHLDLEVAIAPVRPVDESYPARLAPEDVPAYISRKKADAYRHDLGPDDILVTADTVVILDGDVLGKPADDAAARAMLRRLSGRTHVVVTGVTLTRADGRQTTFSDRTEVDFKPLTDAEIDHYVDRYRPLDKAGAYGIQEWIGYIGIPAIRGCYYNVMGLPLAALHARLAPLL